MYYKSVLPLTLLLIILISACQDNDITTYSTAKSLNSAINQQTDATPSAIPSPMPEISSAVPSPGAEIIPDITEKQNEGPSVTWKLPSNWTEKPIEPDSMRSGSFSFKAKNSQVCDISVIAISGDGGNFLSNVNRWRSQIGLNAISENELPSVSEQIHPSGRTMYMVNLVSTEKLIEGKYKSRIIVVQYPAEEKTWFFKITGEDEAVLSAKGSLNEFLNSLKFR